MNTSDDIFFMRAALKQAERAYQKGEVPVGAVVVSPDNTIVARAYNKVETLHTQTAHAEMRAIEKACKKIGDWRLDDYRLYVTLQPCSMCMGLIRLTRIGSVVYGAQSPLFGYQLDNHGTVQVYIKDIVIKKELLAQESIALLQNFFKDKRKKA